MNLFLYACTKGCNIPKSIIRLRTTFWKGVVLFGIFPLIFMPYSKQSVTLGRSTSWRQLGTLPYPSLSYTLFLPIVFRADPFATNTPIWSEALIPTHPQVVLFRKTISLSESMHNAKLALFADTRYEAWFDGLWIGRGAARFSQTLREYDLLPLGDLSPGEHLIAVLVQWAPNYRRAESTRPYLMAHLEGEANGTETILLRSGPDWKALKTSAWNEQAVQVHTWNLIGPTELMDLSAFPHNWNQPSFDDSTWSTAQAVEIHSSVLKPQLILKFDAYFPTSSEKDFQKPSPFPEVVASSTPIAFQPRSIPLTSETSISLMLRDLGRISPGFKIGEINPPFTDPFSISFYTTQAHPLIVKIISQGTPSTQASIDGRRISWEQEASIHPDIFKAQQDISAGPHILTFSSIPASGLTFAVSSQDTWFGSFPFGQGNHAGRRTLLANLASDPGAATILINSGDSLDAEIQQLPSYIILELPRVIHGRLYAQVSGLAGTIIDIGWDERLTPDTQRPLPYPGSLHSQWNQVDSWILDGQPHIISTLDARAGRYILICLWGSGTVQINDLHVMEERFPAEQVGAFHSSDPLLDQIWQTGINTLLPNMTDAYTDTPWRERGQWWGDAYVEEKINQVGFGQRDLLRRGLLYMAETMKKDPSPFMAPSNYGGLFLDYSMLWVHNVWEYYLLTLDHPFVKSLYPFVLNFMAYLENYWNPVRGLLETPISPRIVYIDTLGWHSRYGQATALNGLYAGTLRAASQLAQAMGDETKAMEWKNQAELIKQNINELLFDANTHSYYATFYEEAFVAPTTHAQAFALAYDLVPAGEQEAVATTLLGLLASGPETPPVGTYGMFWVLDALGKSGKIAEALEVIKTYYGYMLSHGATTWWEHFTADQFWHSSLSHGWSGAPTWFLTTYVLGYQRTGLNEWQLRPALQELDELRGEVPFDEDKVVIHWKWQDCSQITLSIKTPENSHGVFSLPSSISIAELAMDDIVLYPNPKGTSTISSLGDFQATFPITGGFHNIRLTVAHCEAPPK